MASSLLQLAPMAAAFIPGLQPLALAGITGGSTALSSMLQGQGPLSSLAQGAMAGGTQFGMNQLQGMMQPQPNLQGTLMTNPAYNNPYSVMNQPMSIGQRLPNISLTNPLSQGGYQNSLLNRRIFGGGGF